MKLSVNQAAVLWDRDWRDSTANVKPLCTVAVYRNTGEILYLFVDTLSELINSSWWNTRHSNLNNVKQHWAIYYYKSVFNFPAWHVRRIFYSTADC